MPQRPTYEDLEERIRELERALDEREERSGSSPVEATEPKRAEKVLEEKKRLPDKLIDAIAIPVFYKDRGGRYIGFNKAFETFFGEARGQLIGKTVFDISPPELAEIYHAKDNALFESGGVQRYESQLRNAQGLLRDVIFQKSVYTDDQGRIIGLIGAILDITSRKRMIKAVQESEERSKALADASFEAIFLSDKGICIDQNQTAERMFGYTHCEAVGRHGTEWIDPEDRDLVNHNMKIGRTAPYEVNALRKDGSKFRCEIQSRMMAFHGRAVGVTALRDISARKQAEKQLTKLNQTLVGRTSLAEQRAVHIQQLALELTDAEDRERKNIASILHDDFQRQEDKIRILIADDHHLIRQALAKMLQIGNKMKVVGQAVDGGEAVRLAALLQPDVVLMDVNMPELNGFEAASQIKREYPHIGIIGLSMYNNGTSRQKMLNAGAAAYLTKTESPETLIETILQVHRRNT
jgi:PAS domain S-box-containing protein